MDSRPRTRGSAPTLRTRRCIHSDEFSPRFARNHTVLFSGLLREMCIATTVLLHQQTATYRSAALRVLLTNMMTSYHSSTRRRYVAHPFRLYGIGKTTDITLAQQAYEERHSPCNDGWCQDIIQAAMLNMTDAAALQLAGRASASPVRGKRRLFCDAIFYFKETECLPRQARDKD